MHYGDCTAPKMHDAYSVNFPVHVLKNRLRLIHGSTVLDHTGTRFLRGRLICGSDLYVSIYGKQCASSLYRQDGSDADSQDS